MRGSGWLVLLWVFVSCDADVSEAKLSPERARAAKDAGPPPVAAGLVRLLSFEPTPWFDPFYGNWHAENRWVFDWLDSEGWRFFGWEIEAGSDGEARIRWSDPRVPLEEIGTVTLNLAKHEPVRFLVGVRAEAMVLGPVQVQCDRCGNRIRLQGTISPESIPCRTCGELMIVDHEWVYAAGRDFRIYAFGEAKHVRAGAGLKSRGPLSRSGPEPSYTVLAGQIPRRCMTPLFENAFDPLKFRLGVDHGFERGTHVYSIRYFTGTGGEGGTSYQVSSQNGRTGFRYVTGDITFEGTEREYQVRIGGEPTRTIEYPHAVWRFEIEWKPERGD